MSRIFAGFFDRVCMCRGWRKSKASSVASVIHCLPAITPHPTLLVSGPARCNVLCCAMNILQF